MAANHLTELLNRNRSLYHRVVPFTEGTDHLLRLDFTAANKELTAAVLEDTEKFSTYIDQKLEKANALYGIGGYNEHRTVYSISPVFDGEQPGDEPRRLHLGIDIWGNAGTPVMAPLGGTVHSFAFNDRYGDYGATIILSHILEGASFYTLYGHLSLFSIQNIKEGDTISEGQVFAFFGVPKENGHWPPHLHFQLMNDIGDYRGDYPGVCKYSEREEYLTNCPDPDIILQMMKYAGNI